MFVRMEHQQKPGWHSRGYLPHFDANCLLQHIVLSGKPNVDLAADPLGQLIEETIWFHDSSKYDVQAWCIMPDHVHISLVFYQHQLMSKMIWTWKKWITSQARKFPKPIVQVFCLDYFDRYVRTLEQAQRLSGYIEHNPVKDGLVLDAADWRRSSAWHRSRGWVSRKDNLPLFFPKPF
jgi:putative transposase